MHKIYSLKLKTPLFGLLLIGCALNSYAQSDTSLRSADKKVDGQHVTYIDSSKQRDVADEIYKLLGKTNKLQETSHPKKINFSVVPSLGYTLSTGFALDITGNAAFYTSKAHTENLSAIVTDLLFDTKNQKFLISRSEIWAPGNGYKLVTDIRYEEYPTTTYGLGTNSTNEQADNINYNYVRVYGTLYKKLLPDFYAGIGYNLDDHYDISEQGNLDKSVSDFKLYGEPQSSTSSGLNADILFDSRRNPINPLGGTYLNFTYRQNLTLLGSDANWQSVQLDMRKYLKLSSNSNNILAFWGIAWFSSSGTPYLDLPATGGDMYSNSGRGYAEGRYRGKNMLYLESEYRFGITPNGLLGGVVFANGETFSGLTNNSLQKIAPGTGFGIRVKANKHSNTNICLDYGLGVDGSHGFFVNLGEVF